MTRSAGRLARELARTAVVKRPTVRLHPVATFALALWMVSTVGILIAHADQPGPTTPTGLGDLIPLPDLTGGGSKSLFEESGFLSWSIDSAPGLTDWIDAAFAGVVAQVWYLALALAYGAIGLVYWLLSMTSMTMVTDPLTDAIGAGSAALLAWLMPSAVVLGLLIAWIRHRGHDMVNAVSWVLISAVLGISLAASPNVWVEGVNNLRSLGSDAVLVSTSAAVSPDQKSPFEWAETSYGDPGPGNPQTPAAAKNVMLRRTADATWRGLVATPWCAIEFGSLAACKRYGAGIIKAGADIEKRHEYIEKTIVPQEGGDDAPTVQWVKGERWPERLALAFVSLVLIVIFCGTLLVLGFSALAAAISAMFHLLVGVFFALTWCIPGRPREIGMRWLESLIGTIIQGLIALATFAALLVLISAIFAQSPTWGWLPTAGVAIVAGLTALKFRRQVESFFGVVSGGRAGAALLGAAAMRLVSRGVRRLPPTPSPRPAGGGPGRPQGGVPAPRPRGPYLRGGPSRNPRYSPGHGHHPRPTNPGAHPAGHSPVPPSTGEHSSRSTPNRVPTVPASRRRHSGRTDNRSEHPSAQPSAAGPSAGGRRGSSTPPPRRNGTAPKSSSSAASSSNNAGGQEAAASEPISMPPAKRPARRRAQTQRSIAPRRRPRGGRDA